MLLNSTKIEPNWSEILYLFLPCRESLRKNRNQRDTTKKKRREGKNCKEISLCILLFFFLPGVSIRVTGKLWSPNKKPSREEIWNVIEDKECPTANASASESRIPNNILPTVLLELPVHERQDRNAKIRRREKPEHFLKNPENLLHQAEEYEKLY